MINFKLGIKRSNIICTVLLLSAFTASGQQQLLDGMDHLKNWEMIRSDGVTLGLDLEDGVQGKAIRFDYDFTKGTGYGGFQKVFPIDLPENYEFSFYLKADSPANNFEIKFIDASGNNVWWVNNRNFDFPGKWKKIRIKKRHIEFAWGPTENKVLHNIHKIEFTVASFVGGKGSIWVDELNFEPLDPPVEHYPLPVITSNSTARQSSTKYLTDGNPSTAWFAKKNKTQFIDIDFTMKREFGGLDIEWVPAESANQFEVMLSDDKKSWEKAYIVVNNLGNRSFIPLPEADAKYMRINFKAGNSVKGIGIREIRFLSIRESMNLNHFFQYSAQNSPEGHYPRYFLGQASYWTISGVNNDTKEALINEDGMVELEKQGFSIEPIVRTGDQLFNWHNAKISQKMGNSSDPDEFSFLPSVEWECGNVSFKTELTSGGTPNTSSAIYIRYSVENRGNTTENVNLNLLLRPFQVNPYYQFLNLPGGTGKINLLEKLDESTIRVNDKYIFSEKPFNSFGAAGFDTGNPVELIQKNQFPALRKIYDSSGLANGVMVYDIVLKPQEKQEFMLKIPYHQANIELEKTGRESYAEIFKTSVDYWDNKVNHIRFNLPESGDKIVNTFKSNLIYILMNRDHAGIQPGSRSYERSWIRDGSLTSSALLKSGIVEEVRDFINWYGDHLYDNGKVPCVVDFRGPDPVPEHDSHGQFIYLIREYFNFTRDTAFLQAKNPQILKVVDYIESLIAERSTSEYITGPDTLRAYYGLVPESISHEGYSAKPMHSYWDNFFILKGLKDAVDIQHILGEQAQYERIAKIRDTFMVNLYRSIDLAMKKEQIDYIPGCVELGDFDATSTTVALTPCNEFLNLPKPQVFNTFNKYYDYFLKRRDNRIEWVNYTPYENRLIGSFLILNQPDRAHQLIDFFLKDQRPQAWHHWAEVVWKDERTPKFIGDMPHTWVGSDFLNAIRTMFVYENELDGSLVIGTGLYQDWIDAPQGMSIEYLPTYYGEISYSVKKEKDKYILNLWGDVTLPPNGLKIENFNGSRLPERVLVNEKEIKDFSHNVIQTHEFPATIEIYYTK